jgi:hypothetical protein
MRHRKEPSEDELQRLADEFDKLWDDSVRRVEENGYPALPPSRDYRGRPIHD